MASSELPPASKNDVVTPNLSSPVTSAKIRASTASISEAGATYSSTDADRSGLGNADRSVLPAALVGHSSIGNHTSGTMNSGSSCTACDLTESTETSAGAR